MTRLWIACHELERPPDAYVVWHYDGCRACLAKARNQLRLFPSDLSVAWLISRMEDET